MASNHKYKWDSTQTKLLIQHYERFPELWNVALKEYRDKEKKAVAVKEIPELLNVSEAEIARRWHNLRCQMNNEIRKMKVKKSGMGADDVLVKSKWEYFDAFHFMIGCVKPQETTTLSSSKVNTENFPQTGGQVLNPDVTPGISGVGNTKGKCAKKSKHSEEDNALKNDIGILNQPQGDDSLFGEYVASELRQLRSIENRKRLKRAIMKTTIEIGEKEDHEFSSPTSTPVLQSSYTDLADKDLIPSEPDAQTSDVGDISFQYSLTEL
ncbi:uncharacterized protein LOC135196604 [Macrobrachium nipponense]|uniref:uncharacterized protein LOC135196604 n=1 Tax=Macrobrachium nipponense TaxID=159736 RepID=UPI0030C838C6